MSSKDFWSGVAVGAGALLAAPLVLPIVGVVVRPLARELVKSSLIAAELVRVRSAILLESLDDLLAEAREEARLVVEAREARRAGRSPAEERAAPAEPDGARAS